MRQRPRRPFRPTVRTLAAVLVVLVATASLGILGIIDYHHTRDRAWASLRADAASKADQLAAALALPLWNFDRAQIDRVIESPMKDHDVYAVIARQADVSAPGGLAVHARIRDANWSVTRSDRGPSADGLIVEDRDVTANGDKLGSVRIYLSPRFVQADLRLALLRLAGVILILDILLSASLYLLLWWIVFKPLQQIEHYAASVTRDPTAAPPAGLWFSRELASLRRSIERMVRLLRARVDALARNEAMLATVINTVPHSIFWKDMRGVYLGGNDALLKTIGLDDACQIIGKTDFDLPWPPGVAERYRADDQEVIASNQPKRHIIEPITHIGGSERWAETTKVPLSDPAGNACGVLGVAEEITERKAAEEALRREKALTDAIFDSVPGVIYLYDEQSRLVRWNAKATEVSGFSDEELQNRLAGAGRPDAERERLQQAIVRVMQQGHGSVEANLVTKDGRLIPYYFTGVRVTLDGRPHLVGIGIDITDRKRVEERLHRALLDAEAANRAKDQFLAAASHELRTPLTPVLLLSSSLEADPHIPADARQDLAVIREHVEVEKRLIGDLLDFTAIHAGKLRMNAVPADINDVLHAAIRTCQKDIDRKSLRLDVRLDARAHFTTGDPDRLRQVFWNLLQNAVKFTPDGGTVTVHTTDDGGSHSVRVEVADSGIGMDPETLQKLFRPFEQGPRKAFQHYGGLGLGLAISKTLVEAHGGSVSAMSPGHNQGSTFIVRLPATVAAAAPEHPAPSRLPSPATPHLRILLVEDHDLTLKTLQRILAAEGHHVTPATTIAEAVKAAEHERFDLVLSDVGLPDGSGCDLMPVLRERFGLPGIALSGFGADGDLEASQRAGFLAHITKPVTLESLRDALTRFAASRPQSPAVPQ